MIFIGIDISKLTFDAAFSLDGRSYHKQFNNSAKGFGLFISWFKKHDDVYTCLEATDIYSFDLAQYLSQHKINIMVVKLLFPNLQP